MFPGDKNEYTMFKNREVEYLVLLSALSNHAGPLSLLLKSSVKFAFGGFLE